MLDGRSWTLAEVPRDESQHSVSSVVARCGAKTAAVDRPDPPAVVTQHTQIVRQFVIINSKVPYCP